LAGAARLGAEQSSYSCHGNEPFWNLTFSRSEAHWKTPELPTGAPLAGAMHEFEPAGVLSWRGRLPGGEPAAGELVAVLVPDSCQDTMADQRFRFTVYLSMPDGSLRLGCCDPVGDPEDAAFPAPRRDPGRLTPIFTPAAESPPSGACYEHEEITGEDGRLVGWLSHDTC